MESPAVDVRHYRGRFFKVLQQTERSQTAVMTVEPGADGGPEETHAGDQVVYVIEGDAGSASPTPSTARGRERA